MKKLLNKTDVLDKGYVSVISVTLSGNDFLDYVNTYRGGVVSEDALELPHVHIEMKCPLFVQLDLSRFNLRLDIKPTKKMEAFIPTIDQISAKDHDTSLEILNNIKQTTEALMLNPKTMAYSGCDTFISQIICPISMYNEIMVSGSLKAWTSFTNRKNLPSTIKPYRQAVENILLSHWHFLDERIGEGR